MIDHIINGTLTLATFVLIYATVMDSHRTIREIISMFLGRSGMVGQHSYRAINERCNDPHKHTGCNHPID